MITETTRQELERMRTARSDTQGHQPPPTEGGSQHEKLGCGINEYERESFSTKEEADNRAAELKEQGWYGVEVVRLAV